MIFKKKILKNKMWFIRISMKPYFPNIRRGSTTVCNIWKCSNRSSEGGYNDSSEVCKTCKHLRHGVIDMLKNSYLGYLDDVDEYFYIPPGYHVPN